MTVRQLTDPRPHLYHAGSFRAGRPAFQGKWDEEPQTLWNVRVCASAFILHPSAFFTSSLLRSLQPFEFSFFFLGLGRFTEAAVNLTQKEVD